MAADDPNSETEDFNPDKTLFFKRRNRHPHLLPILVVGILILGSGALITWALTHSANPDVPAQTSPPNAREEKQPETIISTAQARAIEDPPAAAATDVAGPSPAVANHPTASTTASENVAPADSAADHAATAAANETPPALADAKTAPLNFDINDPTNAAVRAEVLQRVDLMPSLTAASKDKLYASVDHARKMGRVLTFPFAKGETTAHPADIERLRQQVQTPEIKQLLEDPTVVFVVLGYADPKGSEKLNAEISASRAHSVMDALRDKCGFQNVMHSVAMGGSTLFSSDNAEKNRVVEVWAVVP